MILSTEINELRAKLMSHRCMQDRSAWLCLLEGGCQYRKSSKHHIRDSCDGDLPGLEPL